MKKIIYCFMVTCFTLSFFSLQASASATERPASPSTTKTTETVAPVEVKGLLKNVDFNNTAKSTLAANDKKASTMAASARHRRSGGVIYISGGAVVLIILLVILL